MSEEKNGQSSASRPLVWLVNLLPERIQARAMTTLAAVIFIWPRKISPFIDEVALEMKKVSWPTRAEVINTTIITIVVVFFFALFLFGADIALSYVIQGIEWAAKKVVG